MDRVFLRQYYSSDDTFPLYPPKIIPINPRPFNPYLRHFKPESNLNIYIADVNKQTLFINFLRLLGDAVPTLRMQSALCVEMQRPFMNYENRARWDPQGASPGSMLSVSRAPQGAASGPSLLL